MFFPNQTPRQYLVTFRLPSGEKLTESVKAFDLSEAAMQGSIRLAARGVAGAQIYEAGPDHAFIEAEAKAKESARAAEAIAEVSRLAPSAATTIRRMLNREK